MVELISLFRGLCLCTSPGTLPFPRDPPALAFACAVAIAALFKAAIWKLPIASSPLILLSGAGGVPAPVPVATVPAPVPAPVPAALPISVFAIASASTPVASPSTSGFARARLRCSSASKQKRMISALPRDPSHTEAACGTASGFVDFDRANKPAKCGPSSSAHRLCRTTHIGGIGITDGAKKSASKCGQHLRIGSMHPALGPKTGAVGASLG